MPTASGRETATEKDARVRAEDWAAYRSAITDAMRAEAAEAAQYVREAAALGKAREAVDAQQYPAGEEWTLTAGARRKLKVDEGYVRAVALSDALKAAGIETIGMRTAFGLYAGRNTVRYAVVVPR